MGLIRAVEKFDYTKGYNESLRHVVDPAGHPARLRRLGADHPAAGATAEMLSKLSRVERDVHQRLGREPTPEELAVELDLHANYIRGAAAYQFWQPISLDSTIGEDGETSIGDLIEDVDAPRSPSELVDRQLMAEQLGVRRWTR